MRDLYIYYAILLIEAAYGFYTFSKLHKPFRVLTILLCLTLISEFFSLWLSYEIRNSAPPYHFFMPLQYSLISLMYVWLFPKSTFIKYYAIGSAISCIFLSVINTLYFQHLLEFPSNLFIFTSIFTIGLIMLTFRKLLHSPSDLPLHKQGVFWFNTSNFIFYSTTFFYWSFYNYLIKSKFVFDIADDVIFYMIVLCYLLYGLALIYGKKLNSTHDGQ